MPKEERDYWMSGDFTFVHYGKGYQVTKNLQTICVGSINNTDTSQNIDDTKPNSKELVTKVVTSNKLFNDKKEGVLLLQKNKIGRPKKEGPVSRMTEWRRKKAIEQQARLL